MSTIESTGSSPAPIELQTRHTEADELNARQRRDIAEAHHRIKNNLQAVISLIEMQKAEAVDGLLPVSALNESILQIKTIALVHDVLSHEGSMNEVDAGQMLGNLVDLLAVSLGRVDQKVNIKLDTPSIWLPTHAATALALIVNELVSNAYKYGYSPERQLENDYIYIGFTKQENELFLEVCDRGAGFHPEFDVATCANLGLALVQSLVDNDLRGWLTFGATSAAGALNERAGGRVCIRFPAQSQSG